MSRGGRFPVVRALITRPLLRERLRTVLTIAGIAVGVAVIVAIQLSNQSALRAFSESVDAVAGRANYQIIGEAGVLDESLLLALQPFWSHDLRFAPVIDIDAVMLPADIPVRLLAVDLLSDVHFRDYDFARIVTGDRPTPAEKYLSLFEEDSIVVPDTFVREHRLKIGSKVRLRSAGRSAELTIRGILENTGAGSAFGGSLGILDISTAQRMFGFQGKLSRIDLIVPATSPTMLQQIVRQLPANARVEPPSRRNERVGKMLQAFRVNLFALGGVALLVGLFLVYNTVLISVLRRRRDIGIVKTLGVSNRQIAGAFAMEGALLGLIGSLFGIAGGYLLSYSTLELISRTVNILYVSSRPSSLVLTPTLCIVAIAIGTSISLVAALQPAIEASRLRPNALIRPGLQQPVEKSSRKTLTVAAIMSALLALVAAQLPPLRGISVGGYLSVLFVVTAFALISPMSLHFAAILLKKPLTALFSVPGRLAAVAVPVSLRRTSVATAALSVAISMMVAVAIMVGSFRQTVETWVSQTVRSDLWIRPARGLSNAPTASFPASITDAVRQLDFIEAFDRINGRDVIYRDALISVGGADFGAAGSHGSLPMVRPKSDRRALHDAIQRGGVVISESLATKFELDVGGTIELPVARGRHTFPITGIYRDYSNDRGVAVMDRATYVRLFEDDAIQTIAIFLRKGVDPDHARAEIERRLGPAFHAFAVTNVTIRKEVMRIFDQTFLITYALLAIAIVVAVLGIINTLSALILERNREIALLRVQGMRRSELRTMIVLEAGVMGIVSTILGSVAGYVLSFILIFVINKQSFGWTIEFHNPPSTLLLLLAITFVTTLLAGLAPSRVATRMELSTQLKGE